MDIRLTSVIVLIVVVYLAVLGYMGLLNNAKVTSRSRLEDVELSLESQVDYLSKETHLAFGYLKSEFKGLEKTLSGQPSTTSKAEPQAKTRRHSKKPDLQSDETPG